MNRNWREERFALYFVIAIIIYRIGYTFILTDKLQDSLLIGFLPFDNSYNIWGALIFAGSALALTVYFMQAGTVKHYEADENRDAIYKIPYKLGQQLDSTSILLKEAVSQQAAFHETLISELKAYSLFEIEHKPVESPSEVKVILRLDRGAATATVTSKTIGSNLFVSMQTFILSEMSVVRGLIWLSVVSFFVITGALNLWRFRDTEPSEFFITAIMLYIGNFSLYWGAIVTIAGIIIRGDAHGLLRSAPSSEELSDVSLLSLCIHKSVLKAAEKIGLSQI